MERLLADAQKVTGVKYDINHLSDVYEAIHVVQGELGITGTTAKEASETLAGSFSAMKASVQDVLGNLALGQNVQESFQHLAETLSTFLFDNLLPMLGNIFMSLPQGLVSFFDTFIPIMITKGGELLGKLAEGIITGIPLLAEKLVSLSNSFVSWAQNEFPKFVENGGKFIENFIKGFGDKLPNIISSAGKLIENLLKAIIDAAPQLIKGGAEIILSIIKGLVQKGPEILLALGGVILKLIGVIVGKLGEFLAKGGEIISNLKAGFVNKKDEFISAIKSGIKNAWEGAKEKAKEFINIGWQMVEGLVQGIKDKIDSAIQWARNLVSRAIGAARQEADSHSPSRKMIQEGHNFGDGMIVGIVDKIKPAGKAAADMVNSAISKAAASIVNGSAKVAGPLNSLADKVTKAQEKFGAETKKIYDDLIKKEKQLTDNYNKEVDSRTKSLANWADWFNEAPKQQEASASSLLDNLKQQNAAFEEWKDNLAKLWSKGISDDLYEELKEKGVSAMGQIRALANASKEELKQIQDEWNKRQDLARGQVQVDMKPEFDKLQLDLAQGRAATKKELDKTIQEYQQSLGSIRDATVRSLSKNGISSGFVENLIQDIRKVQPELEKYAVIDPTKAAAKMSPIINKVAEIGLKVKDTWNDAITNTVNLSDKALALLGPQGKKHGFDFMTGLISGINSQIGAFKETISSIKESMRSIGGDVSISEGGSIPRFADGAIVNRPTFGVFGEAGPEALMPIEKIDNIMASAINKAGYGGGLTDSKLDTMIDLLGQLLSKDTSIVLDGSKIINITDRGLATKRKLAERGI